MLNCLNETPPRSVALPLKTDTELWLPIQICLRNLLSRASVDGIDTPRQFDFVTLLAYPMPVL